MNLEEMRKDDDWIAAFGFASKVAKIEDVKRIVSSADGENDGEPSRPQTYDALEAAKAKRDRKRLLRLQNAQRRLDGVENALARTDGHRICCGYSRSINRRIADYERRPKNRNGRVLCGSI